MPQDFWKKLKLPIMAVAPMSGVTDYPFRTVLAKYGKPSVFWTEFISAEGLFSKGKEHCFEVLKFDQNQHPIVAQIFGSNPLYFQKAAQLLIELGFDGIDINMGCPDKDIEKNGGGAALIKNPDLAKEIIRAVKKIAPDFPISIKTRIGYRKDEIKEWLPVILQENVSAITVHFRARQELSCPPAHWELVSKVLELRNKYCPETLIIGNGDVKTLAQAEKLVQETGIDGIMVGRGALGNPWLFSGKNPCIKEKLDVMIEHAKVFDDFFSHEKNFNIIRKHFHSYCKGFIGAKELRDNLMKVKNLEETEDLVKKFLESYN